MPRFIDLTGKTFGKLTVIGLDGKRGTTGYWWKTKCQCGVLKMVRGGPLSAGKTKSCGCSEKEWCTKHGMEGTSIYNVWAGMKQRCQNPKYKGWSAYGGRGISVCERWREFENFYADVGDKPDGMSLDRYPDPNGNYEPKNVRWATPTQQQRNRRVTIKLEYHGEILPLAEWAERFGLKQKVLDNRIRVGWNVEKALTTPLRSR